MAAGRNPVCPEIHAGREDPRRRRDGHGHGVDLSIAAILSVGSSRSGVEVGRIAFEALGVRLATGPNPDSSRSCGRPTNKRAAQRGTRRIEHRADFARAPDRVRRARRQSGGLTRSRSRTPPPSRHSAVTLAAAVDSHTPPLGSAPRQVTQTRNLGTSTDVR